MRRDARAAEPFLHERVGEQASDVVDAARPPHNAESLLDGPAQPACRQPGVTREHDAGHGAHGRDHDRQFDRVARWDRLDAHGVEALDEREMPDRLADVLHPEGIAHVQHQRTRGRRIVERRALGDEADAGDAPAHQCLDRIGGACGANATGEHQPGCDHDGAYAGDAHQKVCRTRTSTAYVRSSFCETIQAKRSLWMYSSRTI